MTLPVILAYKRGNADEKAFWRRTLEDKTLNENDLPHAIELMQKHGALAATIERARQYGAAAQAALQQFPASAVREAMLESVSFVIERDY